MSVKKAPQKSVDYIVHFLKHGGILKNFKFPRVSLPLIPGYKPRDYADIGGKISNGEIEVVLAEGAIEGAKAFYNYEGQPRLSLTPATEALNTPAHWSTITHEATHMIQDMKKWRMSLQEMEADAHFAQALFLQYKGATSDSGYMIDFLSAAKAFAANDKRLFRRKCGKMMAAASNKYDGKKGYEDLYIKKKLNGI